jgi:TonB-linked SusC/RagA family outer membrane protein
MPFKTSGLTRLSLVLSILLLSSTLLAQTTITGKVVGSTDKNPVPFATVQVKGERGATQTATDGTFSLRIAKSSGTLVISAVGFETLQVPVNGNAALGILTLNASTSTLNDIVVTGYTAQKKKDITGAVSVVDMKDMKSVPGTSTEALLQGQAAGVQVINSGQPGGGSNIRIRGVNSIANVDPLVIVDGVQSSMHDLNMADIESIQILKDAGAVAIYGIQGSNGVVIVTTKRGKGKNSISYDGFVGTQTPVKGFDLGGSQNYADVLWLQTYNASAQAHVNVVPGNRWFGVGGATYAPPVLPDYLSPTPYSDSKGTPNPNYAADQAPSTYDIVNNQITKTDKVGNNWFKDIFKPALWMQHTLSASGGTDKSSYYMSFSYLDQEGTLIDTYNKRYSVRANTTFNVKDHVRVGENAYIFFKVNPQITNQNEGNAISLSYRIPPLIPTYDIMGNYAGTHSFTINNSGNPVAGQERSKDNKGNDWQINGNVFADVDFLQHFTAHTSVGGTVDNYYFYYFGFTPYENAEGSTADNNYTEGAGYNSTLVWTNTLNYNQQFGDHSVKALIGSEAKTFYGRGLQGQRARYFATTTDYWTLNNGAAATQANTNINGPYQSTLYSLFGRVDYAYKDKYLLSGTIRRDGSSVFAVGYQYGNFPSVSGAWRISKEDFMKDVTWLQDLKLRGSWGKSGNLNNVPGTNPFTLFNSSPNASNYDITGSSTSSVQGFYNSQLGNKYTTWETDVLTDVGADATLGRFDITVDWFRKTTQKLLFPAQLPNTVGGGSAPYVNFGNLQNQGFDGSVAYHQTINKDLKFDILATFTHYTNKVSSLPPGISYYDNFFNAGSNRFPTAYTRLQPGHAVGEFFGYKVIGYFRDSTDVAKSPGQQDAAPGTFKYADVNNSGSITDSDRTWIGNPNPKLMYGLNLSVSYKNWDFGAYFYGVTGNDIFNYVKYWTVFPQVFEGNVQSDLIQNSWTPNNLNPKYPQITANGNFSNSGAVNSWYVEKGGYFRLKSLNIGYSFSPSLLQKAGINRLRVYAQGANLFTITKYTGLDPELQGSNLSDQTNLGIDLGNYPANQKTYIVGLNLNF